MDFVRGQAVLECTIFLSIVFTGVVALAAIPHAIATLCNLSSTTREMLLRWQNTLRLKAHRLGEAPMVITFFVAIEVFNIQSGTDLEGSFHKQAISDIVYAVLVAFIVSLIVPTIGYLVLLVLCLIVLLQVCLSMSTAAVSPIVLCTFALACTYWLQMFLHYMFFNVRKPTDRIPMLAGISLIGLVRSVSSDADSLCPKSVVYSCYMATVGLILSEVFWEVPVVHKAGLGFAYIGAWCVILCLLFLSDDANGFDGPLPHVTWCAIILAVQYLLVHTYYWIAQFLRSSKLFMSDETISTLSERSLTVRRLNGESFTVEFDVNDSIATLKDKIRAKLDIPVSRQRLLLGSTILEDHAVLQEAGISQESDITLIISSNVGKNTSNNNIEEEKYDMANLSFLLSGEAEMQRSMHGFNLGDRVRWNESDNDVHGGEVGAVVGFTHNRLRVEFNRGVWSFLPTEIEKVDLEDGEGTANASLENLKSEDARASVFLCPMLVVIFLVTQIRALELANFLGSPQWWAIILMHLCCWSLLLQLVLCLLSRNLSWHWLRWVRLLCLVLCCASAMLVAVSSIILHKSDALWEHAGASMQPDMQAMTAEEYPLPSSCKVGSHSLCDPEGQLTHTESDQIQNALKSFNHAVNCNGRTVDFHVGVAVAKTFGADFNIFGGERILSAKADEMLSRWSKGGLLDEGCNNGAVILAFTDVRYLAFRIPGRDYISTLGAEEVITAMLATGSWSSTPVGDKVSAGLKKLSVVLDWPYSRMLEFLFWIFVLGVMIIVDVVNKIRGLPPIFFTGRTRGRGGVYVGGGSGGGGFY